MWVGFRAVLVAPSPKLQLRDVTAPFDASVKLTVNGEVPEVGAALNSATGAVPPGVVALTSLEKPLSGVTPPL